MEKTMVLQGIYEDYTTRLYRDHNKPLKESLFNNQDSMETKRVYFFGGGSNWSSQTLDPEFQGKIKLVIHP